jgi:hypothetical protein
MQKNELWPRPEVARRLVERALMDLTGAPSLVGAMQRFVHREDVVAIKVNGIAGQKGQTMAVNYEVILPIVEACLAVGACPPDTGSRSTSRRRNSCRGTRVKRGAVAAPDGVRTHAHGGTG